MHVRTLPIHRNLAGGDNHGGLPFYQQVKSSEGMAEITITSDESGEFRVRTLGLDRNSELKVVVKSGN